MKSQQKSKKQLVNKPAQMLHRFAELETFETECRRLEKALQESEKKYRMIIDSASMPILHYTVDGRILLQNTTSARNLGGIPDDFVGKSIYDVYPSQVADLITEGIRRVVEDQAGYEFEYLFEVPPGSRWYSVNCQPVRDTDDQIYAIQMIAYDVTERKQVERGLRGLSQRLVEVQENERRYLAQELHDQIGQNLTGLKFLLEMASSKSGKEPEESLAQAQTLINELISRIRSISIDLRPPMLDYLGLLPALLWHFKCYTESTGIEVAFQHEGLEQRFPAEVETAIYRIIQESLTNIARHAHVDSATVQILASQFNFNVRISDRGIGFDPEVAATAAKSIGLVGMHERAASLGGQLTVYSAPGHGTNLEVELPLGSATKLDPAG
ncbi:MAG: PAS domain-containing protein [Planctomycetes bacterium]|nr:PAS domain-containing protein [Planctomycetota bacterium]